jgi:GWxTD domain-containing protein
MPSPWRGSWSLGVAAVSLAVITVPADARAAAKLDKAAERWLKEVHLLILPEEEAFYRDLTSPEDRGEFERIFWARRDPDPKTSVNELEEAVRQARKRADELFTVPGGEQGHLTGCGQVLTLLGEPQEREGRETSATFNAAQAMREGALRPETWTYKSREGLPVQFTAGELRISFDEACRFAEGGRVAEDLRRVAASYVVRPRIDYRKAEDGHLVTLDAQLAATGGGGGLKALLASDRADFPIELELHMLLRTPAGEAYAAGLVRTPRANLPASTDPVKVVAAVVDETGQVGSTGEIAARPAEVAEMAMLSWGLTLEPGHHTVRVAVEVGDKAAVGPVTLDVPDFAAPGLKTSALLVFPESAAPPPTDPQDPYAALKLGSLPVQPRFGNVYAPADELNVVAALYGGAADPATGKASLKARYTFMKEGRPIAKAEEQAFETPNAVASVGPVPLSGFAPGRYKVRLDVSDEQSGQTERLETEFEIKE